MWFKTDKPCRMTWVFFVIVGCGGEKRGESERCFAESRDQSEWKIRGYRGGGRELFFLSLSG